MLDVTTNVSSLIAQDGLSRTSSMLSTTLQRLSTGLKINSGADGPAALVISQEQQAQITGLQQAITNTSEATSMVQTTDGALGTVNDLLDQLRSLALDSANSGVNDPNAQAANQAEVSNALATIDRIATNTQFGTKNILDGSAGLKGVSNNVNLNFINAQAGTSSAGSYNVNITTAAQKAAVLASSPNTGNLAVNESLTINGVTIGLTAGQTQTQVINAIKNVTNQTGVTASDFKTTYSSGALTTAGPVAATAASTLNNLTQNTVAYQGGDSLTITGEDGNGTAIAANTTIAVTGATTLQDVLDRLNGTNTGGNNAAGPGFQHIFQHATASIVAGKIVLTSNSTTGDAQATNQNFSLTIADTAGNVGQGGWGGVFGVNASYGGDATRLESTQFGSGASINVTSNIAASGTSSGFGAGSGAVHGVDVAGTLNGLAATGNGNILTGNTGTGAAGISISTGLNTGDTVSGVSGAVGGITVTDNSLVFQIGANANQTVKVGVDNVGTASLGLNVAGNQFGNLGQINVQTQSGAQDSIKVIDAAITQVALLSGNLGAIQSQTLSENAANLQTTLENTTSAEGVIRDTDFAATTANYSQENVLMQVGTAVLQNSNQTTALVERLFQ